MNERMEILNTLKQQLKQPELKCNPGIHCWCAQISFIFDEPQYDNCCLSPQEILDIAHDKLTANDQQYLKSLLKNFYKIKRGT